MELSLKRENITEAFTEGSLFLDGQFFCYTLELPWKNNQSQVSCIPLGQYGVRVLRSNHFSEKFGYDIFLPCVQNVPGREGVEIHGGNSVQDSLGCILVGSSKPGLGLLANSKSQELRALLQSKAEPHFLTIES